MSDTTTTETTVKLAPKARAMILTRLQENAALATQIDALKARQDRLKDELEDVFRKEKQGKALADGCAIDGYKLKVVIGESKKLNQLRLVELGCDPAWLEEATETVPKKPYLLLTAPKPKG